MPIIYLKKLFVHRFHWLFDICYLFVLALSSDEQDIPINPKLMKVFWNAQWISCPGISTRAYGVYHFRKTIDLLITPLHFYYTCFSR